MSLRIMVTGKKDGLELPNYIFLLGKEEVTCRLKKIVTILKKERESK